MRTNNETTKETTAVLENLDSTIFLNHDVQVAIDDLDDMFISCMTSEQYESDFLRQSTMETHITVKRLLQCVRDKKAPEYVTVLEMRIK